jgi:uncharacterized protein YjbJ (UPF0337 family)
MKRAVFLATVDQQGGFFSERIADNWTQLKGKVKAKWGKLTHDYLATIAGKGDPLAGLLQQRYGCEKDQAEKEVDEFSHALKP